MADNIFDMGRVKQFFSKDRTKSIAFGAYNGSMEITISEGFKKGVAPKKVKIDDGKKMVIQRTIEKLIKSPGPNQQVPIRFTTIKRNADGSFDKPKVTFVLQFSTDDKSTFSIAAKAIEDDGSSIDCIAPIKTSGIESDLVLDATGQSMMAMEGLLDFIKIQWPQMALMTRNNLYKPNANNNKSKSASSSDLDFSVSTPASESITF